jgi:hypothetical protein
MTAAVFSMTTIKKVDAPDGSDGGSWYCYVIDNGRSAITGYHEGSHDQVTRYVHDLAEKINARATLGHAAWKRGAGKANTASN